jgi:Tfp pilus assembly protein PilN
MLSLITKIIKFNSLQVLGILRSEDTDCYYVINLKKKKNNLSIVSSQSYSSIENTIEHINTNKPVLVLIDGKGILNKKIDLTSEADLNWKKNLDFESIYFTQLEGGNYTFISFCRRSMINDYLKNIKDKGLQIIDFYIGPLPAAFVKASINEDKLYANEITLEYENGKLNNIRKESIDKKSYEIADKVITKYHLPLYGAGIHFFTQHHSLLKNTSSEIDKSEIIYKKAFELFGKTIVIFFFFALLLSYISIQYLSSENSKLNQENIYTHQTHEKLKDLQQKKQQKLKILEDAGHLSPHFLNYYTYELASSVPSSINIDNLTIFPILNDVKEFKKITFDAATIICSGITASETSFNQWLGALKKMSWIKRFEIKSFKKDKKNIQRFEIKILVKNV